MLSRVLVPMDDSDRALRALEYALENHPDAEITVLHVVGGPSRMGGAATALALEDDVESAARDEAAEIFADAQALAEEHGVEIETAVELGKPTQTIVERAEEFDAVIMGGHGGSIADRLLAGDVAKKVYRNAPVPVTVVQ